MTVVLNPVARRAGSWRQWTPMGLIFLAVGLSTAMVGPFLALFLTDAVHAGPIRVTAFLVAAPVSSVLVSTLVGRWSDARPIRRRLIIAAALVGCAGMVATAFVRDYWVLLALTVTATAMAGVILPQLFAYARIALAGSDRAAMTMSTLRMLFSLAWVAGPFLATVLIAAGGFAASYGTAAGMYALSAIVAWRLLPEQGRVEPSLTDDEAGRPAYQDNDAKPDAPRRVLIATMAALILLQCAGTLGVQSMALFVTSDLRGDIGASGVILGVCAGLEIPLMLGFGYLSTRVSLRKLILAGPLCSVVYALAVSASTHAWQVVAAQLFAASAVALLQGLGVTYVQEMLPRHPGRASTMFTNAFPVGQTLAAPVLGLAAHFGYRTSYVAAAGLAVVAFGLFLFGRPPLAHAEDVAQAGHRDGLADRG